MYFDQNYIFGLCANFQPSRIKIKVQRTPVFADVIILQILEVWRTLEIPDWTLMTQPYVDFDQYYILGLCANFQHSRIKIKVQRIPVFANVIILQILEVWRTLGLPDWTLMTQLHVDFD